MSLKIQPWLSEKQRKLCPTAGGTRNIFLGAARTGNGSQWPRMALELADSSAIFRDTLSACAAIVAELGVDLLASFVDTDNWSDACKAAVGLAAVQIGLVDVLREEYHITPAGVFGHSAGACNFLGPLSYHTVGLTENVLYWWPITRAR